MTICPDLPIFSGFSGFPVFRIVHFLWFFIYILILMFLSKFEQKFQLIFFGFRIIQISGFPQNWPVFAIFFDMMQYYINALIGLKAIRLLYS